MPDDDLISIILSTYNRKNFLEKISLPSVFNQTYKNWELIIVDDASDDGTEEFVNQLINKCQNKIKYLRFSQNQGYAQTLNQGFELSTGNYIALLDADDGWFSKKLEKQLTFMKEKKLKASTCRVLEYDLIRKKIVGITEVGLPGFMASRDFFEMICPLDPNLRGIEDGELFVKLELAKASNKVPKNSFEILKEPLVFYTRHYQALSFFDESSLNKMLDRYSRFFKKFSHLFKENYFLNDNLKNLLYQNFLKYALYLTITNDKKEARNILKRIAKVKKSILWFVIKVLSYFPPKFSLIFKKFAREIIIEKVIYKINFWKFLKKIDQDYKKELLSFVDICQNFF